MNILLLTTHLRMGGVPIYVVSLATALARLGHKALVASSGGELVRRLEKEGGPHIRLDINIKSEAHPKQFAGICRLIRVIKENDINVVHTHTRVTQVMGEALSFLTGARHVSTCHGFFKPRLGRRIFGCWGKKVIAISEAVREHLVNDLKVKKTKVALIHNGIDIQAFTRVYSDAEKADIKRGLGLKDGPVLGVIARLSSVKGHKFLVEAMKTARAQVKDAQLLIVGEGEEEENLKAQVAKSGLSGSVIFIKSVLDTARILSVMDLFVLPSLQEGLGLALLEALMCKRPVVASNVGGICSIIKDGKTGLLVPPSDPGRLAEAILKLLKDKALSERLAKDGQAIARENFSLEDMAKKVEAIYKEVMV